MFRIIIISLFLIVSFSGKALPVNKDVEFFMSTLDGMSLEEAVEYLREANERFIFFLELYTDLSGGLDEFTVYEQEDELYDTLPEFLSPEESELFYTDYLSKLVFSQEFIYPETHLSFNTNMPDKFSCYIKEMYYSDGTTETMEANFPNRMFLTPPKAIDSIRLAATYFYHTGYDIYQVKDDLQIPEGSIKVNQMRGNHVEVELEGTAASYEKIIVLNQEDKVLSYSSLVARNKDMDKILKLYSTAFSDFLEKAERFGTIDELKDDFRKMLEQLPEFYSDGPKVYIGYFQGNVHSVRVYIPQQTVEKEVECIIHNQESYPDLIFASEGESGNYGFLNKSGDFVIPPVYKDLQPVNSFYYYTEDDVRDESLFYHLDVMGQRLVEMTGVVEIENLQDGYVSVAKDGMMALFNAAGENLSGYIYEFVSPAEGTDLLFVGHQQYQGMINYQAEVVVPVIYYFIRDFSGGYALMEKDRGEYVLIDKKGEIILDLSDYEDVRDFSEGTFAVYRNGVWGFIDAAGNSIIPLMYEYVLPFSHGVTLAKKDGYYGLINNKGEVVVPFTSEGYFINTNRDIRTYTLHEIEYDQYGREFVEE